MLTADLRLAYWEARAAWQDTFTWQARRVAEKTRKQLEVRTSVLINILTIRGEQIFPADL
jgi:hypothetical protein